MGSWTPVARFGDEEWAVGALSADGSSFTVLHHGEALAQVHWNLTGQHNALNALAAIVAAHHVGVPVEHAAAALAEFKGVKRRLELRGEAGGIRLYDDFAHHPTAIRETLAALKRRPREGRILAVLEPRSNTMRLGVHKETLADALGDADLSFLLQPGGLEWRVDDAVAGLGARATVADDVDALVDKIMAEVHPGDEILVMSNGAFGGIHGKLLA